VPRYSIQIHMSGLEWLKGNPLEYDKQQKELVNFQYMLYYGNKRIKGRI